MNEFVNFLVTQISIWLPSITSVLGIITTIILSINKCKATIQEIRNTNDFKELKNALEIECKNNKELHTQLELLTDQIAKIKDYSKEVIKERNAE